MAQEIHTPVTAEELAQVFDEAPPVADISDFAIEDWVAIALFWTMAGMVFVQFFTRYVLNDSYAWTEEIAVYCLIGVVFVGSAMCVRMTRHIHVDFLYRYLPSILGRILSLMVDLVRIAFFAYLGYVFLKYMNIVSDEQMTTVNLPKAWVFTIVFLSFELMAFRACEVFLANLHRGYSPLERPSAFDGSED